MKIKGTFLVASLAVGFALSGDGFASGRRAGTAGAAELLIPMGARNIGLGGADIAGVSGAESMYYNPAGLVAIGKTEFGVNFMNYFAGMNVTYFTLGTKVGGSDALGFSLQALDIGDIPVTTIDNPEGTGETINPTFLTLNATYSRQFTDNIRFGVNGKLVSERIGEMSATAVAADFGLQYRSPAGIDIGITMRNYGTSLKFDGTDIEFDSSIPYANPNATTRKTRLDMASHELPVNLGLGVSYHREVGGGHAVTVSGMYLNNSYALDELHGGIEYDFRRTIYLRGGYQVTLVPSDHPRSDKDTQFGLTLGFGFHLKLSGRKVMFDYAYRDMQLFSANQCFGVSIGL
jgi:hypothetical protein